MGISPKIRVLIVDDQSVIRSLIAKGLSQSPNIDVVGTAKDAWEARDMIVELAPDVMTLDVEMPKMSGLEFLKKLLPQYPLRVVMVSSHAEEGNTVTLEALEAGAIDFVSKPDGSPGSMEKMISDLIDKIIIARRAKIGNFRSLNAGKPSETKNADAVSKRGEAHIGKRTGIALIAIGTSTGGTTAIRDIITNLDGNLPAILIVQHMPEGFTNLFAQRLNQISSFEVKEAEDGDEIKEGKILIAPGNGHIVLKRKGYTHIVEIQHTEKVNGHRPSVDVLFQSIAALPICKDSLAIILTGMGKDGAEGITEMRKKGARTIGQDEESSIVYGMPKEAFLHGGVEKQVPLHLIANEIERIAGSH